MRRNSKVRKRPLCKDKSKHLSNTHDRFGGIIEKLQNLQAVENLKCREEILSQLEKEAKTAPSTSVTKINSLSEEYTSEILSAMICQLCHRLPSPFGRFLCPDGHVLCIDCGDDRILKHGLKCMIEINEESISNTSPEIESTESAHHWYYWMGKKAPHFPVCQQKVKLYPADPIFASVWLNATWKCPLFDGSCKTIVKGYDLFTHLKKCSERKGKIYRLCVVDQCSTELCIKDVVAHLISKHDIYALDLGDEEEPLWRRGGIIYVPQSAIEARRPYYTIVRCRNRFFMFCMEPSSTNAFDMGFWIRRISNRENAEDDNPCFSYEFFMTSKNAALKMTYKKHCTSWHQAKKDIFKNGKCLTLPHTMLMNQMVINCEDSDVASHSSSNTDEEDEKGYFPVNFRIFEETNEIGELYRDQKIISPERTSSMESLVSNSSYEVINETSFSCASSTKCTGSLIMGEDEVDGYMDGI